MRLLIGKASDPDSIARALNVLPADAVVLRHGVIPCDAAEFVGIPSPDAATVNLQAPEPVEGEPEGWLYFREADWAAYTEPLVAVRVEG